MKKKKVDEWLKSEEIDKIADSLLFAPNLKKRLSYLYTKHVKANGVELFFWVDCRLERIKKAFDISILNEHRGADRVVRFPQKTFPDGTSKMMTLDEMRDIVQFPVALNFPDFLSKTTITHITWRQVATIQAEIFQFVKKVKNNVE